MRSILLFLTLCSTVFWPIQGSRIGKLEDEVKSLRSFVYSELSSIRHEVKELVNRVDMLENNTVTHDPSSLSQDMYSTSYNVVDETGENGKQLVHDEINEASHVVKAEVQNMRKAYANDTQELHQLKHDFKVQLRELEPKITSHMHNLTADVQHNIENIHENISLANANLSEFMNWSFTNVSIFSDNVEMEIKTFLENTSQHLALQFNETESNIKQNISLTYSQNENNLERFMAISDRNVSEIILKADNLVRILRSNFSDVPTQIIDLALELQATKNDIKAIDERLGNTIESNVSELEKEIASLKECIYKKITHDGYYYPCEKNVRLANASFYGSKGVQGRLEVNHDNNWETVCDDSFQYATESYNTNNVDVVCRMFRFRECKYVVEAGLGKGSGDIWMDHVICGGGESSFLECPQIGWCVHDCGHGEDVGFRMWN
ncbi:putative DMBT1-like protein [Mya arenaria]|uniref:putative DMBT1-like protein n=1 Tax=Mya arenaria TaxID=6604 RepID=UPI0022E09648|nr:putative DMBT1-like protein [Mya arenaria]